ncbi:MAG: prepilin-type N-terminal cleavage/methylation domain-containing protein [Colwellia sp.]|nr:prepilin-type N-terminal cleavage/methylation domain-containing protein [Colwellia sp.]
MNSKGFTLIELVVVIVILGILAVTTVPKFINLQADAKTATLHAIKASLQGAAALVHGKSLVKGNQNKQFSETNSINIGDGKGLNNDGELLIVYGYPVGIPDEFKRLVDIDSQYEYKALGTSFSTFVIYFKEDSIPTSTSEDCIVYYINSTSVNQKPTFQVNDCI